nr:hypothetical protein Iba_chr06cCG15550 [Ipomoea batatas]
MAASGEATTEKTSSVVKKIREINGKMTESYEEGGVGEAHEVEAKEGGAREACEVEAEEGGVGRLVKLKQKKVALGRLAKLKQKKEARGRIQGGNALVLCLTCSAAPRRSVLYYGHKIEHQLTALTEYELLLVF